MLKKKKLYKHLFALFAFLLALSSFVIFLFLNKNISLNNPDKFIVFNLTETPLIVNGSSLNLFETFLLESNSRAQVKISQNEKILLEEEIPGIEPEILNIYVHSAENNICFFKSNVTNFYYVSESLSDILQSFEILTTEPNPQVSVKMKENEIYLFPGVYEGLNLPKSISNKKVVGIYPIKCTDINNSELVYQTILMYRSFNVEEQREIFNEIIEPLRKELI